VGEAVEKLREGKTARVRGRTARARGAKHTCWTSAIEVPILISSQTLRKQSTRQAKTSLKPPISAEKTIIALDICYVLFNDMRFTGMQNDLNTCPCIIKGKHNYHIPNFRTL